MGATAKPRGVACVPARGVCFFLNQVIECNVSVVLSKNLDLCYFYEKTAVRIIIKIQSMVLFSMCGTTVI